MRTRSRSPQRFVATVLFTDVVGSTEIASQVGDERWNALVRSYYELARRETRRFHGREIDTAGDGFFAAFDAPAEAARCAVAIIDGMWERGVPIRAGLHTGECERVGRKVGGIAVHIGARVASLAEGGEVLATGTVRDLASGSGLVFDGRGPQKLKGVPDEWSVFAVDPERHRGPLAVLEPPPPKPAPPTRTRRLPLFGGAGVLIVAVTVGLVLTLGHHGKPSASSTWRPHYPAPPFIGLVGFDAKTGHATSRTALTLSNHGGVTEAINLAGDAGFIWVTDISGDIYKVNPSAQAAVWQTAVPTSAAILAVGHDVWIIGLMDLPPTCPCELTHIDALNNRIVGQEQVPDICCGDFAADRGRAWILAADELYRFDPATGAVTKFAKVGGHSMTVGGGRIWVLDQVHATITPVDETTGRVGTPIALAGSPIRIAFGYGSLWVVDSTGGRVERIPVGGSGGVQFVLAGKQPTDVAVGAGFVWVTSAGSERITKIEPAGGTVVAKIPALGTPTRIAVIDGTVWVADTAAF